MQDKYMESLREGNKRYLEVICKGQSMALLKVISLLSEKSKTNYKDDKKIKDVLADITRQIIIMEQQFKNN